MPRPTDYAKPSVVYSLISLLLLFAIPVLTITLRVSLPMYVWTLYGINTVFFGLALYLWNQSEMPRRLRARATVIDVIQHEEPGSLDSEAGAAESTFTYTPIFRFIDSRTGEDVEAHYVGREGRIGDDNMNNRSSYYWIGRPFNILYKPEDPSHDVRIDSFRGKSSLGCVILAAFGGIVTFASILYLLNILR